MIKYTNEELLALDEQIGRSAIIIQLRDWQAELGDTLEDEIIFNVLDTVADIIFN